MSRKPKKGYWVKGTFVAEGSELDLELKAEQKGEVSKTDLKRESEQLQKLGEALLTLRQDLMDGLALPDKLSDALEETKRITNFEGRRRQLQFVGKLMRGLDEETLQAVRDALEVQQKGSAADAIALHEAEKWRDELITDEDALQRWLAAHPGTDTQQLRALIRQARKDVPDQDAISRGLAPRRGRAYREIFQLVKDQLSASTDHAE
ncbi:ribosome biogenesis factor YjgA [Ramlibacter tataouinensis]|uniref:Dual-action ribosomal maturation protein DarP n=1 Tax=Ramlibacter tataouinensis TaxID=94132 RepID=A0A127JPM1_9BURK|nr:ribosome biogenesis factor YjgA [Ramlibacter tataouinensis]AMO21978.1 ribosome-associated protein [Ramlibacter tataouinensis]